MTEERVAGDRGSGIREFVQNRLKRARKKTPKKGGFGVKLTLGGIASGRKTWPKSR